MAMRTVLGVGAVAAALFVSTPLPVHSAEDAAKPPQVEVTAASVASRTTNARRLLEASSGARRIEASDDGEAKRLHAEAKDLFERAEEASREGDLAEANLLLDESTRTMFEAVRILGPPAESLEKKHTDFENRSATIDALLTALDRIGNESGEGESSRAKAADIEEEVSRARSALEQGRIDEAQTILAAAYEKAKLAIEALRQGKTVVRSLDFATKEEEYLYEIDRNDTHQMLVTVLLEEKRKSQAVDDMVSKLVERSAELRRQAEGRAKRKDFEEAIQLLEQSTKELVRAIRGAGVYIPG